MSHNNELDEIEVIDLQEYACSGKAIPKRVKYYLIQVDDSKVRVESPISAKEILIVADLDTEDYKLAQIHTDGNTQILEPDELVDLRKPGIEKFISKVHREIVITVNGREHVVNERKLSFEQLIKLAYDKPPTGANICFTVTYRDGPRQNPKGSLVEGDDVKVKKGMIFNVTATDKS